MKLVELKLYGFTIDTLTRKPVVLLKNADQDCTVPIWITLADAITIAAELVARDISSQSRRQDLVGILLRETGFSVTGIILGGYNDGAFSASITFSGGDREITADVGAVDAIVASVKFNVPIGVASEVVSQASLQALADEENAAEHDARRFVDYLENLKPEDLGKYPM